jgi:hypothetical protein
LSEVDELLARLVAQFASPYDFLRELVQNAIDAGSDTVEVVLYTHADDDGRAVFELVVSDAGAGMDEPIIDRELTRLFGSSKSGDRTKIGGFGIGFVSVFAWQPARVLVQTGRGGETWELVFHEDRRFEKHRVDEPFEGTTVRLFRRGAPSERPAIAEAVRDSLWRWCRYCPIEITFEDVADGNGPELIQDAPLPEGEALVVAAEREQSRLRVAFAVPSHVTLLRGGLVLAEGTPLEQLPHIGARMGRTREHLRVWADSARLRPNLARDTVIDDAGRRAVEQEVETMIAQLRTDLLHRLAALAAVDAQWTSELHGTYGYLHGHLECERANYDEPALRECAIVRLWPGGAIAPAAMARRTKAGVVVAADPATTDEDTRELERLAARAGLLVIAAAPGIDRPWLGPLCDDARVVALPVRRALSRVEPANDADSLCAVLQQLLARAGVAVAAVRAGDFADAEVAPLFGLGVLDAPVLALHGGPLSAHAHAGATVWLDRRHLLVAAAMRHAAIDPLLSALALALGLHARSRVGEPEGVREAVDALRAEA